MNVKELRIGNYIYWQEIRIVRGINNLDEIITCCLDGSDNSYDELSDFTPIPLTEELYREVVKSIDENNQSMCISIGGGFELYYSNGKVFLRVGCVGNTLRLKHVDNLHSLQNLYFSLKNKELTIDRYEI